MRPPSHDTLAHRPLLVFSDDWDRHPSSSQHLIRRLMEQRPVVWVNTIGTRPPRLDMRTVQRIVEKLGHWVSPTRHRLGGAPPAALSGAGTEVGPRVISPRMWPSFARPWMRQMNRHLIASALRPVLAELSEPPIAITTLPIVADLVDAFPVHCWVYYCVDDFSQWPGYDGVTMQTMELDMLPRMNRVIAASPRLVDAMKKLGAEASLLTHGVDLDHWRAEPVYPCRNPVHIIFWGVVDRRMDVDWIAALNAALERGTTDTRIVLVGPREDPDPRLWALSRVELRGPVPYAQLPALATEAAVLVMPYADLPATRAMQPLKLKEYLATGRPAVVRALPATVPWRTACDVCDTPEEFASLVVERLTTGLPAGQREARRMLERESWDDKASRFAAMIDAPRTSTRIQTHAACSAT